ncbi:MAG TPA: protein tyrosine phosphatase family protein [Anaerolineales bacterium]|jgi:uncharacterized protein (TIGR01244 family)|nr:protein tyrosine phosphatase family protein [Anaerolineales bacterium]
MFEDIRNFLHLSEKLFTGGMPKAEQLTDAANKGVQTVINLTVADADDALPNEKELLKSLGIEYIHIPVEWGNPTRQNLEDFMNAMDAHNDDKVLVHCQANYRATGFVTLYRILRLGWDKETALQDLRKIWNPERFPIWQKFMEENSVQNTQ